MKAFYRLSNFIMKLSIILASSAGLKAMAAGNELETRLNLSFKSQFSIQSFSDEPVLANPDGLVRISIENSSVIKIYYIDAEAKPTTIKVHLNFDELIKGAQSQEELAVINAAKDNALNTFLGSILEASKNMRPLNLFFSPKKIGFVKNDYDLSQVIIKPSNLSFTEFIVGKIVEMKRRQIREYAIQAKKPKIGFFAELGINEKRSALHASHACKMHYSVRRAKVIF